jgi:uncharacterized protein (TIGR02569 family)
MNPPSLAARRAFGIAGNPVPLGGGEAVSYLVGDAVMKRVHDPDEAAWTQALLDRVEPDGFRLPAPLPTPDGDWVHDGWTATTFEAGLRAAAPAWHDIAEIGLRFADAAERVRGGGEDVLRRRTHRWAIADRVAWGESDIELSIHMSTEATDVVTRIGSLLRDPPTTECLVHGDLTGNVCFDPNGVPVILDVSPYLRPRRWCVAIVMADAVLWNRGELSLVADFAADSESQDLLGRALIFRLVAEQLATHPRHGAALAPYRRVLTVFA